jgi:hypothetical protein
MTLLAQLRAVSGRRERRLNTAVRLAVRGVPGQACAVVAEIVPQCRADPDWLESGARVLLSDARFQTARAFLTGGQLRAYRLG